MVAVMLLPYGMAQASQPVTHLAVMLLQPGAVLEERVPSVDDMSVYIKAVEAASAAAVIESGSTQAVGGYIVVAVRPGLKSNVWLDFDALLDLNLQRQLTDKIKAVAPFAVNKGPVVFALKLILWNGKPPKRSAPSPAEWRKATRDTGPLEIGELVEKVWRD
jgi:hypothetical protein